MNGVLKRSKVDANHNFSCYTSILNFQRFCLPLYSIWLSVFVKRSLCHTCAVCYMFSVVSWISVYHSHLLEQKITECLAKSLWTCTLCVRVAAQRSSATLATHGGRRIRSRPAIATEVTRRKTQLSLVSRRLLMCTRRHERGHRPPCCVYVVYFANLQRILSGYYIFNGLRR